MHFISKSKITANPLGNAKVVYLTASGVSLYKRIIYAEKIDNKRIKNSGYLQIQFQKLKRKKVVLIRLVSGELKKKRKPHNQVEKNKMKQRRARAGRKKNLLRKSEN